MAASSKLVLEVDLTHALVLLAFGTLLKSVKLLFIFKFHLSVELLSFFEYLHEFAVNLVAAECLEYVFLVLKLILRLLGLFSSLLFLNE